MFGPPHLEVRRPSPTTVEFIVTTQPRRTGWTRWALAAAVLAVRLLLAASAGIVLWAWTDKSVSSGGTAYRGWQASRAGFKAYSKEYSKAYSRSGRREDLWQALALDILASAHILDALQVCSTAPPWVVLPFCIAVLWASVARVHTSESLLVLRGLGIQTRSTGATYLGDLVSGLSVVWWTLAMPWMLLARFFSISNAGNDGGDDDGGSSSSPFEAIRNAIASSYDGYYGEPTPAATRFIPTEKLQDLLVNEAFRGFEARYYLVAVVVSGRRGLGGIGGGERRGKGGKSFLEEGEEEDEDKGSDDQDYDTYSGRLRGGEYGTRESEEDEYDDDSDGDDESNGSEGVGGSSSSSDEDEAHVVVVFPRLLPGLDIVRTVWREARACLYEPDNKG